ncbi:MAG: single-stranded DNA-binding protein [Bacteroidales bacterium]|nr:single-stranded DNA-binding protein [Bacteroidales bacterium]MCD8385847.1 single-stranded DNA-binding protein [Bacteroidales bacterium]
MNKAILMGYVGRDPEIRYIESRPLATFTLATTERARRSASGAEIPERTEWHNIVMFDQSAEIAEKYIRKGTRLLVEGKIRTRVWEDRNTIKHHITEIYVDSFDILK